MDPVHCERFRGLRVKIFRWFEEIDEGDFFRLAHFAHGLGIEREVFVIGFAVWKVGILKIFVSDGGEEDESGRGLAVVFLSQHRVDGFG